MYNIFGVGGVFLISTKQRRLKIRPNNIPNINKMSTSEKILLLEELWDSITSEESNIPMPQSHMKELDKRLKDYKANQAMLLSLDELQSRIEKMK